MTSGSWGKVSVCTANEYYSSWGQVSVYTVNVYSKSSAYNGPDLRCFEVTNALHKNINDNTVL